MKRTPLHRPSAALVVACLALAITLSGTSYATGLAVPNGSVTTSKIKDGAVTTPKLKNGAVTTPKLKNDAVTVDKLAANSVGTSNVKNGSLLNEDFKSGQLPAGPPGPAGPQGPPGVSGLQRVDASTSSSSANSQSVVATCPSGKRIVGGGARVTGNGASKVSINENFPDSNGAKWNAKAVEVVATGATWQLQAYGLCARVN